MNLNIRHRTVVSLTGACVLAILGGCTKSSDGPARSTSASTHVASATRPTGNACDRKLLTIADIADIVDGPIATVAAIPGDAESCKFSTAGFSSITVSLRSAGRMTVTTWKSGRMPLPSTPLFGVGDDAVWVPDLHEVVAEKSDVLCDIEVHGMAPALRGSVVLQQQKIGALCTKVFRGMP